MIFFIHQSTPRRGDVSNKILKSSPPKRNNRIFKYCKLFLGICWIINILRRSKVGKNSTPPEEFFFFIYFQFPLFLFIFLKNTIPREKKVEKTPPVFFFFFFYKCPPPLLIKKKKKKNPPGWG